ncbi:MAG: metallophosphoesterase, partial [Nitrososphaerales archaeon]
MSVSDAGREKKVPRRHFLKWTGALAVAGAAGIGLGYAGNILGRPAEGSNSTKPASTTSASAISTVTDSSTSTAPATVTVTTTQTDSAIPQTGGTAPAPATQVPANTFSIFWMTDTQFLSESNPALYRMMTKWIVDNWSSYNGKLVVHTGDIVETGATTVEWQNANEAMSVLTKNNIPYSWCAGNHDDLVGGETESGWMGNVWAPAFDPETMKPKVNALGYTSWASDFHDGMNTAVTFSANGWNFLVINVEFNGDSSVVDWVGSLLDDPLYADHKVIIAPHAYMDAFGDINDPRWGPTLSDFVDGLKA